MNYTESFEQFASRLSTTDVALYAGVALVLWVVFKDRLTPVQSFLSTLLEKVKGVVTRTKTVSTKPQVDDVFFQLVVSWKQTRDLAEKSGCAEAVKVADQMFPFLSPTVCKEGKV